MSANFWIKLISALSLFGLAIAAVQLYKSEMVRSLRARFLRRKIVPMVQAMLPLIQQYSRSSKFASYDYAPNYQLMAYRADLEVLFQQAKPLFEQERNTLADFLSSLSALAYRFDQGDIEDEGLERSVLLGQRVIHELTEIGF